MSEVEKKKNTDVENEDWAVLPFDEAEDEARWDRLGEELDELIEKTVATEKLTGPILMKNDLSRYLTSEADDGAEEDLLF